MNGTRNNNINEWSRKWTATYGFEPATLQSKDFTSNIIFYAVCHINPFVIADEMLIDKRGHADTTKISQLLCSCHFRLTSWMMTSSSMIPFHICNIKVIYICFILNPFILIVMAVNILSGTLDNKQITGFEYDKPTNQPPQSLSFVNVSVSAWLNIYKWPDAMYGGGHAEENNNKFPLNAINIQRSIDYLHSTNFFIFFHFHK